MFCLSLRGAFAGPAGINYPLSVLRKNSNTKQMINKGQAYIFFFAPHQAERGPAGLSVASRFLYHKSKKGGNGK